MTRQFACNHLSPTSGLPDISSTMSSKNSPSAFAKYEPIMAMGFKQSSIGMSKTRAYATPTSNPAHRNSMARSNAPTEPMNRNFTSCSLTKMTSISVQNWLNRKASTISRGHTVHSMERHLTKSCGRGYNQSTKLSRKIAHITYNFSRPYGAFHGKTPYKALREKL